jgi:hypothetical protein
MADLLETIIEAHGGLDRWQQLDTVSVHGANGGAMWGLKGQAGVVDDVFVRASLHEERESHRINRCQRRRVLMSRRSQGRQRNDDW